MPMATGVPVGIADASRLLEELPNKVRAAPEQLTEAMGAPPPEADVPTTTTPETTQEIGPRSVSARIMTLLAQLPAATRTELAEQLGMTADGVKYHLSKLRGIGAIRHIGPTKGGRWEVIGKP